MIRSKPSSTAPRSRRLGALGVIIALATALLVAAPAATATAEVVGTGPGTISGTVATIDGLPLESIYVYVSTSYGQATTFFAYTTTDSAGNFEFTGLEADKQYDVQASVSGYQRPQGQVVPLTVASPVAAISFVVLPFAVGVGTISGQVTGDGVPLAGLSVSADENVTGQNLSATTDENGYYQFTDLPNGQWNVNVWAGSQYQDMFLPSIQLTDGAPTATINLPFVSWPTGGSSISGVITDAATGATISNVSVSAFGHDATHSSWQSTDETGTFAIEGVPAGTYGLSFWAYGYLPVTADVEVLADQSLIYNVALIAANSTISGHVKGPNGAPVANIYVDAHTEEGNSGGAMTDANGDFVISNVGAVGYTISVGGPGTLWNRSEAAVTGVAGGNVTADFSLTLRTTGSLSGFVKLENGEDYSLPACVTLYSSKSKKPLAEVATLGENFGDGSYNFENLKPGKYTVEARDCDNDPTTKFDKVFLGGAKNIQSATYVAVVAGVDSWGHDVTLTAKKSNNGHTNNGHNGPGKGQCKGHDRGHDNKGHGYSNKNKGKH